MNAQYILKDDWESIGSSEMWKKITEWMNAIAKQLNRAEVVSGGTARPTDLRFRIEVDGAGADTSPWSLSCSIASPVVSVTAGTISFADQVYTVSGGDVTLTGATEYVYVYHMKDHNDSGIGHVSTYPISNGDRWYWTLAKYTATARMWTLSTILRRGDIDAYLPLR